MRSVCLQAVIIIACYAMLPLQEQPPAPPPSPNWPSQWNGPVATKPGPLQGVPAPLKSQSLPKQNAGGGAPLTKTARQHEMEQGTTLQKKFAKALDDDIKSWGTDAIGRTVPRHW